VRRAPRDVMMQIYRPAVDPDGHLMIGTAIGINGNVAERARNALESGSRVPLRVTILPATMETRRPVFVSKAVRASSAISIARIIWSWWPWAGVGPGAMCTTRMQTGVGRPQFSAVLECAEAAAEVDGAVWADGGVRHPRDVALARTVTHGASRGHAEGLLVHPAIVVDEHGPGRFVGTREPRANHH
jgi:IMP dehydrogenase